MKFFTVFVDGGGVPEVKLGTFHEHVDRDSMLRRPSDFAEFNIPAGKDEGVFLRQKFGGGVTKQTAVVVVVAPGRQSRAWRVRV